MIQTEIDGRAGEVASERPEQARRGSLAGPPAIGPARAVARVDEHVLPAGKGDQHGEALADVVEANGHRPAPAASSGFGG